MLFLKRGFHLKTLRFFSPRQILKCECVGPDRALAVRMACVVWRWSVGPLAPCRCRVLLRGGACGAVKVARELWSWCCHSAVCALELGCWCRCKVLLQRAAVRVVCELWNWIGEPLQGPGIVRSQSELCQHRPQIAKRFFWWPPSSAFFLLRHRPYDVRKLKS